jgi:pimaricinolide synthase PimS1
MSTSQAQVVEALRSAVKERDRLRRENRRLLAGANEPIAIVGMACRFPGGASSPAKLWELVAAGRDAIGDFPADRGWDLEGLYDPDREIGLTRTTSYGRQAGFIDDAGDFDADFFGLSPLEALKMEPQQRLWLEVSWQALEDAGIDPRALARSQTGVFAGLMYQDYGDLPGMAASALPGRLAYLLGFQGPAMAVDAACSSAVVALHLAAQALRKGECSLALAGGVNVLSSPGMLIHFSRQGALAADGRSRSFAEAASGTGLSEGLGVLALERLSDAERAGRPVLALLKGSAVGQDGASNGLTAPNGPAQERLIRQALASARVEPREVDVVEGHGTGTTLGDPIEVGALLATYGQDREAPLLLGSVKSNIGHSLAAAGVAGVIKMVEALRHGVLPRTIHVDRPSTNVDWSAGAVELLTENREWAVAGRPRRAGVSSFGATGTIAHLILEEAPSPASAPGRDGGEDADASAVALPGLLALPLSAKTEPALREAAANLAAHLRESPELDLGDVGFSLATTRPAFERRAVVVGAERGELLDRLDGLGRGESPAGTVAGEAKGGKLAYLFTGQGAQRAGMGKELYEGSPVFAAAFDEVCAALDPHLAKPLAELVFAAPGSAEAVLLDRTEFTQPALFAIEVALFRLLESLGLKPDLLAGHSIGELSAAHLAGVLSLQDAAKLVAARGRLMGELPAGGAMVAIEASEAEVSESIEGKEDELSIAAVNGPRAMVVSGAEQAVAKVEAHWSEQERKTKRLTVSHAFHSPLIEPMLEEFEVVANSLSYKEPETPIVSTLTGETLSPEQATDPAYWASQVRGTVRFADAVETLADQGVASFLELGPDGVLCAMAAAALGPDSDAALIPTLREGREEPEALVTALASAHAHGAKVDWPALYPAAKRVPLPTYPFQRQRFWLDTSRSAADIVAAGLSSAANHPLLATTVELADGGLVLSGRISLSTHPWLADHAVLGTVILPGTAFAELALAAGKRLGAEAIESLTLQAPMVLPESAAVSLQVSVEPADEQGGRAISIHSRGEGDDVDGAGEWILHASGSLGPQGPELPEPFASWPPEGAEPIAIDGLYERLAALGFEYGPAFQGLAAAWSDGDDIYAEVSLPEEQREEAGRFAIHPALLDAAFHAVLAASLASGEEGAPTLPFDWNGVRIFASGAVTLRLRASLEGERLRLFATDAAGAPAIAIESLAGRPIDPAQLAAANRSRDLYRIAWEAPAAAAAGDAPASVAVLGDAEIGAWALRRHPDLEALVAADAEAPRLILCDARAWSGGGDPASAAHAIAGRGLELIQSLLATDELAASRLAFLTAGALEASDGERPDPAAATLAGLLRSASSERPDRFALIDLDGTEASLAALPAAVALLANEPQLALREGAPLTPRLAAAVPPGEDEARPPSFDPERTVLLTGATGALGTLFARHLVAEHGARHLLLASRRGPEAEGAAELVAELEALGAEARIAACDVADREQVAELLASIDPAHPLGAVVHAAGVLDDGVIEALDPERIDRVFAPKVDAAWHLHELTADLDLSAFVLFSSVSAALGGPGQGNYAAANSFLDALAARRRAEGLAATAIAWGLWERESAMTAGLGGADRARIARSGIGALSDERGLALFDSALGVPAAQVLALSLDRAALRSQAAAGILPPVFSGLVRANPRRRAGSGDLAAKLVAVPAEERDAIVLELVRAEIAAVLGHDSVDGIEPGIAFKDLGFDSLAAVELRHRLVAQTGLALQATAVFDHPNPAKLAEHLAAELAPAAGTAGLGEEAINASLGQLEASLSAIGANDLLLRNVQARLRAFLASLADSASAQAGTEASEQDLGSLSNDEIFELIDDELGGDGRAQAGATTGEREG